MRRLAVTLPILAWGFLTLSCSRPLPEIDWHQLGQEAGQLLSQYIQLNTVNPPGNETAAARFFQEHLAAEGIESQVFESQPGRGIVYARLKGSGEKRPVVLLHHMDVVPADPEEWDVDPFSGAIKDGYVSGRGALDCKGVGVVEYMAMIALKRSGLKLSRDIIFLATGDEEVGGQLGAGWFVENYFDLLKGAEFLLNEGDHIHANGRKAYHVDVAEKAPCWLKMEAVGEAGHGSMPPPETAVTRLIRALEKIRRYETEITVVPAVQKFFAALAEGEESPRRENYRNLARALADPAFFQEFTANPRHNALIRNTIAPTLLAGSPKTNVIPSKASAHLDCRLLPGEDPQTFIAKLKNIVDDAQIRFEVLLHFPPLASDENTELFRTIQTVAGRHDPQVPVVPSVLTGFTDSHYFRKKGIVCYGFVPFELEDEEYRRIHGTNERVSLENLSRGTRLFVEILQELGR